MEFIIKLNGKYYARSKEVPIKSGGIGLGGFGYQGSKGAESIPQFSDDRNDALITLSVIDLSRRIKSIGDAIRFKKIDMKWETLEIINIQRWE